MGRSKAGSELLHLSCLGALLALHDLKLDLVALGERLEAVPLNRAEMDEDVGAAFT